MDKIELGKVIECAKSVTISQTLPRCWVLKIQKQGDDFLLSETAAINFKSLKSAATFVSQHRKTWQVDGLTDGYAMSAEDARSIVMDA